MLAVVFFAIGIIGVVGYIVLFSGITFLLAVACLTTSAILFILGLFFVLLQEKYSLGSFIFIGAGLPAIGFGVYLLAEFFQYMNEEGILIYSDLAGIIFTLAGLGGILLFFHIRKKAKDIKFTHP